MSGYAARVSAQLGNSLQCIDGDGNVTGRTGKVNLPVTAADQRGSRAEPVLVTRHHRGESYRTITIPGSGDGIVRITRSLARTNDLLASIRERSVLIGLGVMALAALCGWLIASRTARPIVRLTAAAEEVATTGRLDHPVPATGRGEVGRLTRAFTSMLHALRQSSAQQQRLVQDASHELRTPLTSLRTNLDTLRRHTELDPELRERVMADLDSELQELGALANELVQLTVDTRSAEPEAPVQLDRLAKIAAERAIRRSGRTVTVTATPTTVIARRSCPLARRRQPAGQRHEVQPVGDTDRDQRLVGLPRGSRPRPGNRSARPSVRLRSLLPRGRRQKPSRIRPRALHRPRGDRCERWAHLRRKRPRRGRQVHHRAAHDERFTDRLSMD